MQMTCFFVSLTAAWNWLAGAPAEGIASSTDSGRSSANTVSVEPSTIACSTAFEFAHISGPVIVQ